MQEKNGMTFDIFETWMYRLAYALFVFRLGGWLISAQLTGRIFDFVFFWFVIPLCIFGAFWRANEARRTGTATMFRFGSFQQKIDRNDPMFWLLAVGASYAAAAGFIFFFLVHVVNLVLSRP
jgi:hypothetical protein